MTLEKLLENGIVIAPKNGCKRPAAQHCDITITESEKTPGQFYISYRNDTWERLGERIKPVVYLNRLYFVPDERGYKIGIQHTTSATRRTNIVDERLRPFVGDYEKLVIDNDNGLSFVEKPLTY